MLPADVDNSAYPCERLRAELRPFPEMEMRKAQSPLSLKKEGLWKPQGLRDPIKRFIAGLSVQPMLQLRNEGLSYP